MWRHQTRLAYDQEWGLMPDRRAGEFDVLRYTPPYLQGNTFIIVIVLVFLSLGVAPASLVLWFCLGIFFVSTCMRLGHMEQLSMGHMQQQSQPVSAPPPPGGPFALSFMRSASLSNGTAMLLLPPGHGLLHLAMMDRDWRAPAGSGMMYAAPSCPSTMLTEGDLSRLSSHVHGSNCQQCNLSGDRGSNCDNGYNSSKDACAAATPSSAAAGSGTGCSSSGCSDAVAAPRAGGSSMMYTSCSGSSSSVCTLYAGGDGSSGAAGSSSSRSSNSPDFAAVPAVAAASSAGRFASPYVAQQQYGPSSSSSSSSASNASGLAALSSSRPATAAAGVVNPGAAAGAAAALVDGTNSSSRITTTVSAAVAGAGVSLSTAGGGAGGGAGAAAVTSASTLPPTSTYPSASSAQRAFHSSLLRAWSSTVSLDSCEGNDAPMCSVCLGGYKDGHLVTTLPCRHAYHRDCIYPWLLQQGRQATCPMCKAHVFE